MIRQCWQASELKNYDTFTRWFNHINSIHPKIKFTIKNESDNCFSFLDKKNNNDSIRTSDREDPDKEDLDKVNVLIDNNYENLIVYPISSIYLFIYLFLLLFTQDSLFNSVELLY